MLLPSEAEPLLLELSKCFSRPTAERWLHLLLGAVLTTGRRTISNILRTMEMFVDGDPSSYHRVLSERKWSLFEVGRVLARYVLAHLAPKGDVELAVDDTVDEHPGDHVFGKGCHRDAVRSSHNFTSYRWGHRWVVLSVLVKFPFSPRPWALPLLVALYRNPGTNAAEKRHHKTPSEIARQLFKVLRRWFPERKFILSADQGFATHDLAGTAGATPTRSTFLTRMRGNERLYGLPAPRRPGEPGRGRIRGKRLPSPREVVRNSKPARVKAPWYGGSQREVEVVTGTGYWYHASQGLVLIRWVFVRDRTGRRREEYFLSTDAELAPERVIEIFTGRWSEEVTFQEVRDYCGVETTRGWTKNTVLRAAPSLFGMYTVVACLYAQIEGRKPTSGVRWSGKSHITFSDAITSVRRWLWDKWVFRTSSLHEHVQKLPDATRKLICAALSPAA